MHFSHCGPRLTAVNTLHHPDHPSNGVCSNEEPWLTFSAALDPAFGVQEVTQHATPSVLLHVHSGRPEGRDDR